MIIRGCCRIIKEIQIVVDALVLHPPLLNHIQQPRHIQPIQ